MIAAEACGGENVLRIQARRHENRHYAMNGVARANRIILQHEILSDYTRLRIGAGISEELTAAIHMKALFVARHDAAKSAPYRRAHISAARVPRGEASTRRKSRARQPASSDH